MPRTYIETVQLGKDLTVAEIDAIWRFVLERLGAAVAEHRASVRTHDETTIVERTLAEALATLAPGEEVNNLDAEASDAGVNEFVHLRWHPSVDAFRTIMVHTPDQTRALGVAEATRRFIKDRRYADKSRGPDGVVAASGDAKAPQSTGGVRGWLHGLSIEVVGGLIVIGIAGLVGVLWAVLR